MADLFERGWSASRLACMAALAGLSDDLVRRRWQPWWRRTPLWLHRRDMAIVNRMRDRLDAVATKTFVEEDEEDRNPTHNSSVGRVFPCERCGDRGWIVIGHRIGYGPLLEPCHICKNPDRLPRP